ncbi:hypothetical protein HDU86_006142 [Geranomyces michiganensis]|nr:hypothetical protein HDU86_006142 [Geranomyces michiganensis]
MPKGKKRQPLSPIGPDDPLAAIRYKTLEPLGKSVVRARREHGDTLMAVKTKQGPYTEGGKSSAARELGLLSSVKHGNVMKIREHFLIPSPDGDSVVAHFVMECCGSDLKRKIAAGLPSKQVWRYLEQILSGIAHIHSRGIIHGDLKPGHILILRNEVRITDFSVARRVTSRKKMEVGLGTPVYCAPEMLGYDDEKTHHDYYGPPVDMWSIGCILYEMMVGNNIYGGDLPAVGYWDLLKHLHIWLINRDLRPIIAEETAVCVERETKPWTWEECSTANELIVRLLQVNADQRWSAQECLKWLLNTEHGCETAEDGGKIDGSGLPKTTGDDHRLQEAEMCYS